MKPPRFFATIGASMVLLLVYALGIAGSGEATTDAVRSLERIAIAEVGDRIRVEIEGAGLAAYSVASSEVPASLTVELPGFSQGIGLERMDVNKPPLLQLIPHYISKPRSAVQLSFVLTEPVKPEIHRQGANLLIDLPKQARGDQGAPKAQTKQGEGEGPMSRSAPSQLVQPPARVTHHATVMDKVEVQRGDGEATVVIRGDGAFAYHVQALKPDRLIVDLPDISAPTGFQVLPVDHPVLKRIRIGRHSDRVRLVLDLSEPVHYDVEPGKTDLAVRVIALGAKTSNRVIAGVEPHGSFSQETTGQDPERDRIHVGRTGLVPFRERVALRVQRPLGAQKESEILEAEEPKESIGERKFTGRRISLDFQQADIQNVFRLIAEVSGLNIVIGEGVKGKVTMRLVNVPWDQALEMLLKMNNLGKIRSGNIVWIDTLANVTKQQEEEAKAKEARAKAEDLVTRVMYIRNVPATEVQNTLRQYLSPRGQLTVNAGANALVVQDTPSRVAALKELVDLLDVEVPQIQIEARIVLADTTYARGFGVQWGVQDTDVSGSRFKVFGNLTGDFAQLATGAAAQQRTFMVNLPAAVPGLSSAPGVGLTIGKLANGFALDARLAAGETLGLTKVIAAPKITTLDKRQARIAQGESVPYQTTSLQGTQTTFVDANLELAVTPQITSRDPNDPAKQILLQIKATRNAVGARSTPAGPSIDRREATTQVLVRDGETAVIGGIFVDSQINNVSGVPYLSRIPVLGWLFKNKSESVAKQELLIFLTPYIIKS
jgi:type IV pilus assembly protein PilQ